MCIYFIQDVVTRYAHQSGFHVERRFGWDCHGLPVEYEIDKTLGIKVRITYTCTLYTPNLKFYVHALLHLLFTVYLHLLALLHVHFVHLYVYIYMYVIVNLSICNDF